MFSKKQRLNTEEFNTVFKQGKGLRSPFFVFKYKKSGLPYPRFAVAVSKKIAKTAVQRHLLKRRFLNSLKESKIMDLNYDFLFVLNKEITEKTKKEITLIINEIELE